MQQKISNIKSNNKKNTQKNKRFITHTLFEKNSISDQTIAENTWPAFTTPAYFIWTVIALLFIAVWLCYSDSFNGSFVYDDRTIILDNPTVLRIWPFGMFQDLPKTAALFNYHTIYSRPITNWSFALNYALGGFEVFGYHVFNLTIHLLSMLFVFGIVRRTLLIEMFKSRWSSSSLLIAAAIALCWGLHPLHTNAITYLTQRLESLAGFFYLATLYCLIRSDDSRIAWGWLGAGVIAACLGMGSKETMVTAPLMALLYDRMFMAGSFKQALLKRPWFYTGLLFAWVLLAVLVSNGHQTSIGVNERGGKSDIWLYAVTQFGVILHYLKLTIWPHPLILDYFWPAAKSLNAILVPGMVVTILAGITLWGVVRNKPWSFIGAWFFIILSPSSSFVPIMDEYVNEYRMYLPSLAPLTLIVMTVFAGMQWCSKRVWPDLTGTNATVRKAGVVMFVLVTVFCASILGLMTYRRNQDYSTEISIWTDNVKKAPENPRGYLSLGKALSTERQFSQAIYAYQKAIALYPNYFDAYNNLGIDFSKTEQFDLAAGAYEKAAKLKPNDPATHINLGVALESAHQRGDAIIAFQKAVELDPKSIDGHNNLGVLYLRDAKFDLAIQESRLVLKLNPRNLIASEILQLSLNAVAINLFNRGDQSGAVGVLREVLSLNPDNVDAKHNLAVMTSK